MYNNNNNNNNNNILSSFIMHCTNMTLTCMKLFYFLFKKIIYKRAVEDRAPKYYAEAGKGYCFHK